MSLRCAAVILINRTSCKQQYLWVLELAVEHANFFFFFLIIVSIFPATFNFRNFDKVARGKICAEDKGTRKACVLNSGGMMTTGKLLIGRSWGQLASTTDSFLPGLPSWGHFCSSSKFPGVYTDTIKVNAWVEKVLRNVRRVCPSFVKHKHPKGKMFIHKWAWWTPA